MLLNVTGRCPLSRSGHCAISSVMFIVCLRFTAKYAHEKNVCKKPAETMAWNVHDVYGMGAAIDMSMMYAKYW